MAANPQRDRYGREEEVLRGDGIRRKDRPRHRPHARPRQDLPRHHPTGRGGGGTGVHPRRRRDPLRAHRKADVSVAARGRHRDRRPVDVECQYALRARRAARAAAAHDHRHGREAVQVPLRSAEPDDPSLRAPRQRDRRRGGRPDARRVEESDRTVARQPGGRQPGVRVPAAPAGMERGCRAGRGRAARIRRDGRRHLHRVDGAVPHDEGASENAAGLGAGGKLPATAARPAPERSVPQSAARPGHVQE